MKKTRGRRTLKKVEFVDIQKIRFAPEIEVEFPEKVNADRIIEHEKIRGWEVKYDGSLENGAEFVPLDDNHLYYNQKGLRQIQDVLKRIARHKGRISHRCGLHIHVDVEKIDDEDLSIIIKEFIRKQRWIVSQFKVKKNRLDASCQLLPRKYLNSITPKKVQRFRKDNYWNCEYDYFDRNSALNILCLPSTKSIEFRLFNGSCSYEKVKESIHWVLMFMKGCLERDE